MSAVLAHAGYDHVLIGVGAAALVGAYGAAWLAQPRPVLWRLVAWVVGIGCVLTASLPWMEGLAEESFTGHMVQHLLVIIVGAPLLVLAQPVHTLGRAGWLPTGSRLGPGGRRWAARWRRYAPVLGPLFFIAVLFATHLTSIYDRALDDRLVHELEHAAYLLGATLTWAAVLGVGRGGAVARIGGVFGVAAGGALLGMVLLSAPSPLIPTYEERLGAASALSDQRSAAALMWVGGMLTTVPLLLLAVWRWAVTEDRVTRRAEALRGDDVRRAVLERHRSSGAGRLQVQSGAVGEAGAGRTDGVEHGVGVTLDDELEAHGPIVGGLGRP